MQQTKNGESHVEGFRGDDGRVYLYDPSEAEAWIDTHEDDFLEVTP